MTHDKMGLLRESRLDFDTSPESLLTTHRVVLGYLPSPSLLVLISTPLCLPPLLRSLLHCFHLTSTDTDPPQYLTNLVFTPEYVTQSPEISLKNTGAHV